MPAGGRLLLRASRRSSHGRRHAGTPGRVGHRAIHELFDTTPLYDLDDYPEAVPEIGAVGDWITVTSQFDGWGYVHLFDAATLEDLDAFVVPEATDPAYASGFDDLSVHKVATDPSVAYLSYYSGGLRAIQIQCGGAP